MDSLFFPFVWLVVTCATYLGINSYGLEAGLPEGWKKKCFLK